MNRSLDWVEVMPRPVSPQQLMLRGVVFLTIVALLSAGVGGVFSKAVADRATTPYTGTAVLTELAHLRQSLDMALGERELMSLELSRAKALLHYSARFKIPADLAGLIHDAALRESIDPELAFRLVKVESNFNPRAASHAAAFGLAQVQVPTARHYEPNITVERLFEPERNLRIGFRYLRDLYGRYAGDMRLALLAYNVGPSRLNEILEGGRNLPNGQYASSVLDGYSYPQAQLER